MAFPAPPTYHIRFTEDGRAVTEGPMAAVQLDSSYVVDDVAMTRAFGSTLSPELADLVDLALAIYVSDRISRRRPRRADRSRLNWTRRFELTLPMRDTRCWRDEALYQQLHDVLWQLTEDDWHFHFIERRTQHRVARPQLALFPMPPTQPVTAALFSGGLDSLAGLYYELITHPRGSIVLFSVSTNDLVRSKQQQLARLVRERSARDIIPVNVPLTLSRGQRLYHDDEPSQRSRGFLFGVLGAVTAIMAGAESIACYENGVGAINLPYTSAQLGTHSSRSAHPGVLSRLSSVITKATGRPVALRSPFLFLTKGELCGLAAERGLAADLGDTVSCDGFPGRRFKEPHCGLCTSCLLRRQAVYAAGLHQFEAANQYTFDLVNPSRPVADDELRPLRMMLAQVDSLRRALTSMNPWRQLVSQYPELWEVEVNLQSQGQDPASIQRALTNLYRTYCDEWLYFPGVRASIRSMPRRAVS
jgi:7-cyano-7-deazaguanine synthase in queuosine biosynthesis